MSTRSDSFFSASCLILSLALVAACSESETAADSGTMDASDARDSGASQDAAPRADASAADSAPADTGMEPDAGAVPDAGAAGPMLGKFRITVDGMTYEADGALPGFGNRFGAGAYFMQGPNCSVGWEGTTTGTFESSSGALDIIWNGIGGQWRCRMASASSTCSLVVSVFGPNVGDRVEATFSGTLVRESGTGPDTVTVDGAFNLLVE